MKSIPALSTYCIDYNNEHICVTNAQPRNRIFSAALNFPLHTLEIF